ncbi:MAG: ester cyclase [Pseudomonadota bacterium]|nr:ester cyclase [Pseudomonadota bacterium]
MNAFHPAVIDSLLTYAPTMEDESVPFSGCPFHAWQTPTRIDRYVLFCGVGVGGIFNEVEARRRWRPRTRTNPHRCRCPSRNNNQTANGQPHVVYRKKEIGVPFLNMEDRRYDDRARELIRVGKIGIARGDEAVLDAYFAKDFRFHGPSAEMGYPELKAFFTALRNTFSGFGCERQEIVSQGKFVGCLTTMFGRFERPIAMPPVGEIQPNGADVSFQLINMFRYNAAGELAEEWVQYDTLDLLRQMGVELVPAAN